MNRLAVAVLVPISVLAAAMNALGCATDCRGALYAKLDHDPQRYDYGVQTVLRDARRDVSPERMFDTPTLSWPGQEEERALPLVNLESRLRASVAQRFRGDRNMLLLVRVEQAVAGWRATMFSEIEFARAKLAAQILDPSDQAVLATLSGVSWAECSKPDALDEGPAQLLDLVAVHAFEQMLDQRAIFDGALALLREKYRHRQALETALPPAADVLLVHFSEKEMGIYRRRPDGVAP
jgi:hypothetical protein